MIPRNQLIFEQLFESAADAIVACDAQGHIIMVNTQAERMFGYHRDELAGQGVDILIPDLFAGLNPGPARYNHRGAESSTPALEVTAKRKGGSEFQAEIVLNPVQGNQWTSALVVVRKVSEPKQTAELLQQSEERFHRLMAERKRLERELEQERDRLRLLLEVTNTVISNLDLRQLFYAVSAELRRVMKCDSSCLSLLDMDKGRLRLFALDFPKGQRMLQEDMSVPLEGSAAGLVLKTGKPIVTGDADRAQFAVDVFRAEVAGGLKSACWLPLINRNRILGVLGLARQAPNAFGQDDVAFFQQIAHQVAIAVGNALDYGQATEARDKLAEQKLYLEEEIRTQRGFQEIIGVSPAFKSVLNQVETVAPTDCTVLIQGETGTGKEVVAQAIHNLSARRRHAFVTVNCAAIPLGLLESELFGHEKGAFTGAVAQKTGRLELAHKGTLFLDEVGDIPLELQPKLLRVLQEQEFERLGSNRRIRVDVRWVAATNRDLAQMVEKRQFRADLYYRLKVFPLSIPPLRERPEDIPLLVRHFVRTYSQRMNKQTKTTPSEILEALTHYRWPGNIRELQNFIERSVILSPGDILQAPLTELGPSVKSAVVKTGILAEAERELILQALRESDWVVGGRHGAATRLGIPRTTLISKMQRFGIRSRQTEEVTYDSDESTGSLC